MILLSFDIEEFDMPLEYHGGISFEEQIEISKKGLENILYILNKHNIKATFFSTVIFAENNKYLIEKLLSEGHELASHTWFHSEFSVEDLKKSKERLEELFNTKIIGLRMPRMSEINVDDVEKAGYLYNSASVSPFRIPLFWLSFHNFPIKVYRYLVRRTLSKDNYLNIYFHPWEFVDITNKKYKLPTYTTRNTGEKMQKRFDEFIFWLKKNKAKFVTFKEFYDWNKQKRGNTRINLWSKIKKNNLANR